MDGDLTNTKVNPYRRVVLSALRRGSSQELGVGLQGGEI